MMKLFVLLFVLIGIAVCDVQLHCVGECQQGDPNAKMLEVMPMKLAERFKCEEAGECPIEKESLAKDEGYPCVNGMSADEYPCSGVNMMSFVAIKDLGGKSSGEGSDIWGWTDPEDNSELPLFVFQTVHLSLMSLILMLRVFWDFWLLIVNLTAFGMMSKLTVIMLTLFPKPLDMVCKFSI